MLTIFSVRFFVFCACFGALLSVVETAKVFVECYNCTSQGPDECYASTKTCPEERDSFYCFTIYSEAGAEISKGCALGAQVVSWMKPGLTITEDRDCPDTVNNTFVCYCQNDVPLCPEKTKSENSNADDKRILTTPKETSTFSNTTFFSDIDPLEKHANFSTNLTGDSIAVDAWHKDAVEKSTHATNDHSNIDAQKLANGHPNSGNDIIVKSKRPFLVGIFVLTALRALS